MELKCRVDGWIWFGLELYTTFSTAGFIHALSLLLSCFIPTTKETLGSRLEAMSRPVYPLLWYVSYPFECMGSGSYIMTKRSSLYIFGDNIMEIEQDFLLLGHTIRLCGSIGNVSIQINCPYFLKCIHRRWKITIFNQ